MWEEKKIVSWALIILFLSLTIVYSLVYMRKKDVFVNTSLHSGENAQGTEDNQWTEDTMKTSTTNNQTTNKNADIPIIDINAPLSPTERTTTWTSPSALWTGEEGQTTLSWVILSNTQTSPATGSNPLDTRTFLASTGSLRLLSGTSQFFGILDIVDVLGVQPNYTLQDTKGNYFASYGEKGLDFVRTVQQLGGNVYTMATESEILSNQLFGDKVSFINMAVFKDRLVLMVIEIEGETWLIQVPATSYHTSKSYLKSLFIS